MRRTREIQGLYLGFNGEANCAKCDNVELSPAGVRFNYYCTASVDVDKDRILSSQRHT